MLLWAAGAVLVTAPLLAGALGLRQIARRALPPAEASWPILLQDLAAGLGLRRPVMLRESDQISVPMTWGLRHPVVLLPAHARDWSPERRRLVLLHELAHVQRADCLTQLLAQITCALYWFHPLAWIAARQLRMERERACDDRVLTTADARASAYAQHLLEIARRARGTNCAALAGVAMARPSQLEGRLLAVLDADRSRRAVSRLAACIAAAVGSGLVLPLAAIEASAGAGQNAEIAAAVAGQRPAGGIVIRQVWPVVGDISGTVSADGRRLSFVDWETGDLAIRELATGTQRRLTNKGTWAEPSEYALESLISPDGKRVAYTWVDKEKGIDLRLIGLDRSEPRVLYRSTEVSYLRPAAWSPDGDQVLLLLHRKTGPAQMALVSVVDGAVRG